MNRLADAGKLILRLAVGGLLLSHGLAKLTGGVGFVEGLLAEVRLPSLLAYGSYVGEVLAPVLLILGIFSRPAGLVVAINMFVAIMLALRGQVFSLKSQGGGLAIELER